MGDNNTENLQEGVYLTLEEMNTEVLECARYGEHEELRDLIVAGADVNYCDDGGTGSEFSFCDLGSDRWGEQLEL